MTTVSFPKKRFGQHFLERAWADKLVRAIDPRPEDTFVEIGAGRGALTLPLAARVRRMLAIEIDTDLARLLQSTAPANVSVLAADVLDIPADQIGTALGATPGAAIRVAGNLPYNVGSPILFRLVDWYAANLPLADATVMLQREVADRLVAPSGVAEYGLLTIGIRQYADVDRLLTLPPGAFRPSPKVQSAVVRLRFRPPEPSVSDVAGFRQTVQAIFTRRRKTLANALLAVPQAQGRIGEVLKAVDLDPRRRPQTLTLAEFGQLFQALSSRL